MWRLLTDVYQQEGGEIHPPQVFNSHPKLNEYLDVHKQLKWLLRVAMKSTDLTDDERYGFRGRAETLAETITREFPDWDFFNYAHMLFCHAYEYIEKYGCLGDASSICCEAMNALWKDTRKNHEPRHGDQGENTLARLCARNDA